MIQRGDVVVVDFPFTDSGQSKVRPALIVQNDRNNQRIRKTVMAMITGNIRRKGDPSHLFIDPKDSDGASSCNGRIQPNKLNSFVALSVALDLHFIFRRASPAPFPHDRRV